MRVCPANEPALPGCESVMAGLARWHAMGEADPGQHLSAHNSHWCPMSRWFDPVLDRREAAELLRPGTKGVERVGTMRRLRCCIALGAGRSPRDGRYPHFRRAKARCRYLVARCGSTVGCENGDQVPEEREVREREFALIMHEGAEALRREIDYDPTRWMKMVRREGAVAAAKRLLALRNDTSAGLTTLALHRRLDQSVEWFVLVYDDLFEPEEREVAHRRLKLYEAPVDRWLQDRLGRRHP